MLEMSSATSQSSQQIGRLDNGDEKTEDKQIFTQIVNDCIQ